MYYISIALIIIFISLLANHLYNNIKNSTFEGLENKVSSSEINSLFLSTDELKSTIKKYKTKNDKLNSELDVLEKKINCKNSKNNSYSDATKSKHTELKNKQKSSQNFSLKGF
jgi:Skp family chaperone for outer membrane proteins